jgi:hypothetical protein
MSKINQVNFKCDDALFAQICQFAAIVERTTPDFTRMLVESCLKMVDNPSGRIVPPVIQDVIDRKERTPLPLAAARGETVERKKLKRSA